eukprot:GHVU01033307.1.p1 GENE.GHVU01033307.1~~GHVU01033307.1.p1  ORF type:complete len:299 (+),score=53.53 GHVU01033307.1:259-1155(+)
MVGTKAVKPSACSKGSNDFKKPRKLNKKKDVAKNKKKGDKGSHRKEQKEAESDVESDSPDVQILSLDRPLPRSCRVLRVPRPWDAKGEDIEGLGGAGSAHGGRSDRGVAGSSSAGGLPKEGLESTCEEVEQLQDTYAATDEYGRKLFFVQPTAVCQAALDKAETSANDGDWRTPRKAASTTPCPTTGAGEIGGAVDAAEAAYYSVFKAVSLKKAPPAPKVYRMRRIGEKLCVEDFVDSRWQPLPSPTPLGESSDSTTAAATPTQRVATLRKAQLTQWFRSTWLCRRLLDLPNGNAAGS